MRISRLSWLILVACSVGTGCNDGSGSSTGGASGSGGTGGTDAPEFDAYAANLCVGEKQSAAGSFCATVFSAWSAWETDQDASSRDSIVEQARATLQVAWSAAEDAATTQGVDCADLALTGAAAAADIEARLSSVVDAVNDGLTLNQADQAACGATLLSASGRACADALAAESVHIRSLDQDPDGATVLAARDTASADLISTFNDRGANCPTSANSVEVASEVSAIVDAVVVQTIVTPGLDDTQYTRLAPGPTDYLGESYTPQCVQGLDYHYFVRRGSVNKLLIYYQGGGACWNGLTCGIPSCRSMPDENLDEFASEGFFDLANENNPFRDWNIAFVSYCTCDIHFGDASVTYSGASEPTQHLGYHNAKVAEKWLREHFVNPGVVFVTGSSAGAYGAWFHGPALYDVWPASQMHVLADAGNGVITEDFLENEFSVWNFVPNLPDIPGVLEAITESGGMPAYTEAVANRFPDTNWAHYSAFYDGSPGGQSGFYNVMLNDGSPAGIARWWDASCEFGELALAQSEQTFAMVPSNYRYYFGTGSAHTVFRNNKVYDDTTGGVPALVDWINPMLESGPGGRDPAWTNVVCNNCGLILEGDPQPTPLEAPFEQQGEDIVIVCE